MLIAVDIGNTNVTMGVLKKGEAVLTFKFNSAVLNSKNKAKQIINEKFSGYPFYKKDTQAVYVCSVVPSLNKNIREILTSVFHKKPLIIGEDVVVPIINRYRITAQVGQDRLVNAYAGLKLYGPGLIIVDFGTAITFDIVSKKSEYLGGLIAPGLKLMQEALHKKTALLPYVELSKPIEIIGQDTVSSIRAGIIYGVAGMCDGIITHLLAKECKGFKVIATGGDLRLIKPYSSRLDLSEDFLILKGLYLIYNSQKNKK